MNALWSMVRLLAQNGLKLIFSAFDLRDSRSELKIYALQIINNSAFDYWTTKTCLEITKDSIYKGD